MRFRHGLLGHTFSYDGENRPYLAGGVNYYYDGESERVAKSNGKLYWFGTNSAPVLETDTSGNTPTEYGFFNGKRVAMRKSDGSVHYYFADQVGSADVVTNATGAMPPEQDIEYHPYGVTVGTASADHYRFTGKERDTESGLDNFRFRYYASTMGRFMSADDGTDQDGDNPQSWNLYSYVRNNPLKYTDPDGHDCIYIDNDSGKMTGFNRGDCDNSTEEKANSGVYVNGTVNSIELNNQDQVTGYSGTGEGFGVFTMGVIQPPGATPPPKVNDPGMIPGLLGPGDLVLFSGVRLPSVVTEGVGKLVGSILGKGVQQGVEQGAKESVQLTTHAALRLGQRGITQAAVDEAVATAKAAGQVATQMGKYGTEQIVYKGTNGITAVVETQGSNAGKAITAFQTGSKP